MTTLTMKQTEVLGFIKQFTAENGCSPTRAEIAKGLGWRSANSAELHLRALSKKGAIAITPGISRGIRVLDGGGRVTITRQQYRSVCDALLNTANLNAQLTLLSAADKRSRGIHRQASELLQAIRQQLQEAVGEPQ